MSRHRFALLAAVALWIVPLNTAQSQFVRGRAVGGPDSTVVAGAILELLDSGGALHGRTLSAANGMFVLRAPGPGTYRVRALRIGYRPTVGPPIRVEAADVSVGSFRLTQTVVQLAATRVVAASQCTAAGDSASDAFGPWEEARKALQAAVLTRASGQYSMLAVRHERQTSVAGKDVLHEEEEEFETSASRPFVSVDPGLLARHGYVLRDTLGSDGTVTYTAPDEEVLLSEQFATTHCFKLAPSGPSEVAIEFEPTPDRRVTDVAGILVLDRATAELRRLEFRYAAPRGAPEPPSARGRMHFRRLPTGGWIVASWELDLPVYMRARVNRVEPSSMLGRGTVRRVEIDTIVRRQLTGGEVWSVSAGGKTVWTGPTVTVTGTVRDSLRAPVTGAIVRIGNQAAAPSSAVGGYELPLVRPGLRTINVSTPASMKLGSPAIAIRQRVGATGVSQDLIIPTSEMLRRAACPRAEVNGPYSGFLRGTTRGASGERAGGILVSLTWTDSLGAGAVQERSLRAKSLPTGDFSFCGVIRSQPVSLVAKRADGDSTRVVVRLPADGIAQSDITVP